ncbi:hypothetical protein MKX08_007590 [Trichoderma sp. CBMAI-0020]|nr:hypothetical protein MKX08_007590 [Trichoderma sp. CBMAI-0020]
MYLKAIKALRSNLKDHLESLTKHKKLKRNSGTFGRKRLRMKFIKPTNKLLALLISLRKLLKLITANGKGNRKEKPRKAKQDDYITKDNGTRPGRIDINAINYRRFNGIYNACGKKGHKEADCCSKMTCGFCGKKGHNETHCYTKKNAKPKTPKDKAQIDTITEIPHNHLSWTACYNDLYLIH